MKIITEKITEALEFCALAHNGQERKNSKVPYASHPNSVGFVLYSAGYKEDVVIAGLLHDVIEDTTYKEKDIEERFGEKVLKLVLGVTENKNIISWQERKDDYLKKVSKSNKEIQAISAADMLDNLRGLIREVKKDEKIWNHFGANKKDILSFYQKRFEVVKNALSEEFKKEIQKSLKDLASEVKKDF